MPEQKGDLISMTIITDIFKSVKELTFTDVLLLVYGEKPDPGGKIICDFHDDHDPSFQVNTDYGYCFACGWRGDIIKYISERENIRPIEAARLIAQKFNLPIDRSPSQFEQQKVIKSNRKRNISKQYQKLEEKAFLNMANFRSRVIEILSSCGLDIGPEIVDAVHMLPQIENNMLLLATGSPEDKLDLLRRGELTKWAKIS